mgnify:CR=1 FL=1
MFRNEEDFLKAVREQGIDAVDLKFVDLAGRWHHITLHKDAVGEKLFTRGVGFDGSSVAGFTTTESGDLVMVPDFETAFIDPFWDEKILSVTCWIREAGAIQAYDRDPRTVFIKAMEYLKTRGIADESFWNPELEFYIFDKVEYNNHSNLAHHRVYSSEAAWDKEVFSGHKVHLHGGYHCIPPTDQLFAIRQDMAQTLSDIGIRLKYHHHEVGGPGQSEIEFALLPGLHAADAVMIGKYVIKMVAHNWDKTATFMPKPLYGEAGNGLHFHIKLTREGQPIFFKEGGYADLSEVSLSFIAGVLHHGPSLSAITNPSTNSYKRLVPGFEAPSNLFFSLANRSAAIRIPKYANTPEDKRFEFRPPDATCNPYLTMAGILMAGASGVEENLDPTALGYGPYDDNIFDWPEERRRTIRPLPTSLRESLGELQRDHSYLLKGNVFSPDLIHAWLTLKEREVNEIQKRPHPYEFHLYYSA